MGTRFTNSRGIVRSSLSTSWRRLASKASAESKISNSGSQARHRLFAPMKMVITFQSDWKSMLELARSCSSKYWNCVGQFEIHAPDCAELRLSWAGRYCPDGQNSSPKQISGKCSETEGPSRELEQGIRDVSQTGQILNTYGWNRLIRFGRVTSLGSPPMLQLCPRNSQGPPNNPFKKAPAEKHQCMLVERVS